jgi:branched-chain amino acid aminotransferase
MSTNGTNGTNGPETHSTPSPTTSIDWHQVGFKVHQVHGHAHATWHDGKWSKPEFRADELLHIHGFASCLNYGQVCLLEW